MSKIHSLAIPALILAAVFGGLGPIFGKFALKEFSPMTILTIRNLGAFLIFLPILILKKELKVDKKDLIKVLFAGLLFSGNIIFFLFGLQLTTSIMSQLLYLLVPMITIVLSTFFLKQKFQLIEIAGVIIGFLGVFLMLGKSLLNPALIKSLGSFQGNFMILMAVLFWSCYLIYTKKIVVKYSPLALTGYSALISLIICLFFLIKDIVGSTIFVGQPSFIGIVSIICLILLNSVAMMFFFQWGNKYTSPFVVAITTYLSPIITVLAAIPLLGERITGVLIISFTLICLGLYLAIIHPLLAKPR